MHVSIDHRLSSRLSRRSSQSHDAAMPATRASASAAAAGGAGWYLGDNKGGMADRLAIKKLAMP